MDRSIFLLLSPFEGSFLKLQNQRLNPKYHPALENRPNFSRLSLRWAMSAFATLKSKLLWWKDRGKEASCLIGMDGLQFCQAWAACAPLPYQGLGQLPFHDYRKHPTIRGSQTLTVPGRALQLSAQRDRESASPAKIAMGLLRISYDWSIAPDLVIVIVHGRQIIVSRLPVWIIS